MGNLLAALTRQAASPDADQFRAIIENVSDVVTILAVDGTVLYESPSIVPMLGWAPADVVGRSVFEFVHPEDAAGLRESMASALARPGQTARVEMRWRHRAGPWRVLEAEGRRLDDGGSVFLIGTSRDITERRLAEVALCRSEARYQSLFNNAMLPMYRVAPDGRFEAVNPACAAMLGYESPADLMALRTIAAVYADPATRDRAIERALGGEPRVEVQWKRKDGSAFWVRLNGRVIRADESVVAFEVIAEDVDERRQLEDAFRQAQKMEAVGRLAGGIAHDFNNLLTAILGYSDLLLDRLATDDAARADLEEIRHAGQRAAALTRQLLAFGRKQVLQPQLLDLSLVVAETEKMLKRVIGEDVALVVDAAPRLRRVLADAGQIEQVLMNLAVNARDAMPSGGRLTLRTSNVRVGEAGALEHLGLAPGEFVRISVEDTGTGMTEETRRHLFEPFFTTKERGKGTGLGLATVYGIVRQTGGQIDVDTRLGGGTTFAIYLPVAMTSTLPAAAAADGRPPSAARGDGLTILVVEDEHAVRALARAILERQGYSVLHASSGADACEIARRFDGAIALLLSDVMMPEMNGYELADRLVASRPGLPVLFMSGYADPIAGAGAAPPRGVLLHKPFHPEDLSRAVRHAIETSRPRAVIS